MSELIYTDGNLDLYAEEQGEVMLLHSEMERITPGLYKKYLVVLTALVETVKQRGKKALYIFVPEDEEKGRKYVSMFGFEPVGINTEYKLVVYQYPLEE